MNLVFVKRKYGMSTSAEYLANDVTLFAVGYKTSKDKNSEGAMYYLKNMQEWNECGISSFRRRLSRELLLLSKRDGVLEKKALACG